MLPLLPAQGNGSSQIWQGVSCACLPALSRALPAPQLLAAGCASTRSSAQPCSQLLCSFLQRGPKHLQLCGAAPRAAAGEAAGWTHHGMPKHAQAALHQEHRWRRGVQGCVRALGAAPCSWELRCLSIHMSVYLPAHHPWLLTSSPGLLG